MLGHALQALAQPVARELQRRLASVVDLLEGGAVQHKRHSSRLQAVAHSPVQRSDPFWLVAFTQAPSCSKVGTMQCSAASSHARCSSVFPLASGVFRSRLLPADEQIRRTPPRSQARIALSRSSSAAAMLQQGTGRTTWLFQIQEDSTHVTKSEACKVVGVGRRLGWVLLGRSRPQMARCETISRKTQLSEAVVRERSS